VWLLRESHDGHQHRGDVDELLHHVAGLTRPARVDRGATWPLAIVQTCVLYLIRNTFRLASRKDWDKMARDLRQLHTAHERGG
jgi:hypothetical protein